MVKRRGIRGFTLIEAMLVVAIVGIIAGIGAKIMIQANRYFIFTRTKSNLQKEARAVLYIITRELRQAKNASIVVSRIGANQPFYSEITFTKEQGTSMTFEQSGNSLVMIVGSEHKTLTTHLAYLAFSFPRSDDMSIISVDMTLTESIYQGEQKALHMASEKVQVMN